MKMKKSLFVVGGLLLCGGFLVNVPNQVCAESNIADTSVLKTTLFDQMIKEVAFDQNQEKLILTVTKNISEQESLLIREHSATGNAVGIVVNGSEQLIIDYAKLERNQEYFLDYYFPAQGIHEVEKITNEVFLQYVRDKNSLAVAPITSDSEKVKGNTAPFAKVLVDILADEEIVREIDADENGDFEVDIPKILPGRLAVIESIGKNDTLRETVFIKLGEQEVTNWFYNPTFENNLKGWDTYGATNQVVTHSNGLANFVDKGSLMSGLGAIQMINLEYGSLYKMNMKIRVNEFKEGTNGEFKEIYLGSVIPGGGIDPSFSERVDLTDKKGEWVEVVFEAPYFGNSMYSSMGFNVWGVKNMDIAAISLEVFNH